jgi:hypothetical protein
MAGRKAPSGRLLAIGAGGAGLEATLAGGWAGPLGAALAVWLVVVPALCLFALPLPLHNLY